MDERSAVDDEVPAHVLVAAHELDVGEWHAVGRVGPGCDARERCHQRVPGPRVPHGLEGLVIVADEHGQPVGVVVAGEAEDSHAVDLLSDAEDREQRQPGVGLQPVVPGAVDRPTVLDVRRHVDAVLGEPLRHRRSAAPGVEHEVGQELGAVAQPQPGDPQRLTCVSCGGDEAGDDARGQDRQPRLGLCDAADGQLEGRTPAPEPGVSVVTVGPQLGGSEHLEEVDLLDAVGQHPVDHLGDVGEQQVPRTCGEGVGLAELGDVASVPGDEGFVAVVGVGCHVSLDDRHGPTSTSERDAGREPGDAAADHRSMSCHASPPPSAAGGRAVTRQPATA